MYAVHPTVPQFLLDSSSSEVEPGFIKEGDELVRTRYPDHYRRCIGHVSEAFFAFPQRCLNLLPLRNI
jgi:hypothetical protein